MKKDTYVRLTKLAPVANAKAETPKMEDYKLGQLNLDASGNDTLSLPVDYWVEGHLICDIEVGCSMKLDRRIRNGVSMTGVFISSPVTKIEGNNIYTGNSHYIVEDKKDNLN